MFSNEREFGDMFLNCYRNIKKYMRHNGLHHDVNCFTGTFSTEYQHALGAFFPGLKVLAGDLEEAAHELSELLNILKFQKFLPELINHQTHSFVKGRMQYPLRPELIESVYYMYLATKNYDLLDFAFEYVDRLENMYSFVNLEQELNAVSQT